MTASQEVVTPVKTGVQRAGNLTENLDSGIRWNDGKSHPLAFYETVKK